MKLLEHQGKQLLAAAGVPVPAGRIARTPDEAAAVARESAGRVALKSQVPTGKRGKAGGILFAEGPEEADAAARRLLGAQVGGHPVTEILVESGVDIAAELYLALLNDPASKSPMILFSDAGGMDVEEVGAREPERLHRGSIDIREGLTTEGARTLVAAAGLDPGVGEQVVEVALALYGLYRRHDADMVEVNPLVVTRDSRVLALDAKITLDPGALPRQDQLLAGLEGTVPEEGTERERRARELGLQYIELDGEVGVLANGAGLTMTTLDAVTHFGGRPANFMEIGGDAYTKAVPALRLVLDNPRVRSLVVNFCGAFARTDVMAEGVVTALEELRPDIPVSFTIHGTGEVEAVRIVTERLGAQPYDRMDDAVRAAVRDASRTDEVTPA